MNWEVVQPSKFKSKPIWLDYQELDLLDLALDDLAKEAPSYLKNAEDEDDISMACTALDTIDELQEKIRRKKDKYESHD